jgi:hypothetical protein
LPGSQLSAIQSGCACFWKNAAGLDAAGLHPGFAILAMHGRPFLHALRSRSQSNRCSW